MDDNDPIRSVDVILPAIDKPIQRLKSPQGSVVELSKDELAQDELLGEEPGPFPESPRSKRARKAILVIEDDASERELLRKVLTDAGYDFVEASSGEEGLRVIMEKKPDLVLLDYLLPFMDGAEVLHELTNNPVYRTVSDTPVIMLTAKTRQDVNHTRLFQLGLRMFLEKPFASRELINVIENVFILHELHQHNRELEQRIKRTEYKYQDLIENASDLIFTLNIHGQFVFINRRLSVLTGFLREAWKDRNFLDMVLPEDRASAEINFRNTLKGKSRIFEMRIRAQTGKIIYLSTNINPIFDRGEVVGCVGIARDVTQRKKLEQEITELKNFNESIIQSIGSGLMTVDLERRITSFNQAAEEVLGWRAYEVVGRYIDEIFSPEECHRLLPSSNPDLASDLEQQNQPAPHGAGNKTDFTTATESGGASALLSREMELKRKDGKTIYIGFSVTPRIDNRNQRVGTIISFRDISLIKQMQAEVLRMDRLASLGVLASGIAHEIRNPLAGIKTVAQTLEEEIDPNDNRREYIARIIRQVNRMDDLLKTLFSYARPKSPVPTQCRLQDIVSEAKALMQQRFEKHGIEFIESYAPDLPLVCVDFQQIQQVLINLFLNAIDAMPSGGRLSVMARPRYTLLQRVDRRRRYPLPNKRTLYAELNIIDTGEGIPRENLQAIFDPFFTTKPQGSGLGLSIVYRIIEEHHGDIQVQSEVGRGTTFSLLLPTEK
ncbi:MAG: PAS domain S-box protein [candidate division KSB1 bacterium]|nr:PAS domain S-box protein [candidate division KSB1 bacterium]MDZ7304515.1 PAS domain S-box protein [candidate division KSB1 bacterium]MDZ7313895.1 PAS domain S-box protein [candidate division KSB1 bacterium]